MEIPFPRNLRLDFHGKTFFVVFCFEKFQNIVFDKATGLRAHSHFSLVIEVSLFAAKRRKLSVYLRREQRGR